MKRISIAITFFFIALSVLIICLSLTYPSKSSGAMGPGFFPMIIAGITLLLCILLLINIRKDEAAPIGLSSKTLSTIFLSLIITIVYVVMISILGFPLATFLYLIGIMKFYGAKGFVVPLVISVCVTGLIHGVFTMFLSVILPQGIIF